MSWINAGVGTHYADGWINTDLKENDLTRPDIIVTNEEPFPFPDGSAERVYMGHVLEHVVWQEIPAFLAEVMRVLQPGGQIVAVGPDTYRTIEQWRAGRESWDLVVGVLEHAEIPGRSDWPNAHHQWNCHEQRMVEIIEAAGFEQVKATMDPPDGWPVKNWSKWQCCVSARKGI
jgi:predicted SAM-dependent methyltransferase